VQSTTPRPVYRYSLGDGISHSRIFVAQRSGFRPMVKHHTVAR